MRYEVERYRFPRAMGCALGLGALAATVLVHVVISIVAPGDAGTLSALVNPLFLILIFLFVGLAGLIVFPIVASLTWPLRNRIVNRIPFAALVATTCGAITGYLASFVFADHWYSSQLPGITAGGTFGLVWIFVIRMNARETADLDAFS